MKFEEDVEEGGERWSKPHVASLQLRAIHELKDLLSEGIVLLHTDANDFENVVGEFVKDDFILFSIVISA